MFGYVRMRSRPGPWRRHRAGRAGNTDHVGRRRGALVSPPRKRPLVHSNADEPRSTRSPAPPPGSARDRARSLPSASPVSVSAPDRAVSRATAPPRSACAGRPVARPAPRGASKARSRLRWPARGQARARGCGRPSGPQAPPCAGGAERLTMRWSTAFLLPYPDDRHRVCRARAGMSHRRTGFVKMTDSARASQ